MIVPDANVLIHAYNRDSDVHGASRRWLEATLSSSQTVGLAWVVLLAFVRLTTRPGVFPQPLTLEDSFGRMETWLERPNTVIVHPGPRHAGILRRLLESTGTGGNLTTDAHLAALALEHQATICSWDRDFTRFHGVTRIEP